jgi:hypothetical protein
MMKLFFAAIMAYLIINGFIDGLAWMIGETPHPLTKLLYLSVLVEKDFIWWGLNPGKDSLPIEYIAPMVMGLLWPGMHLIGTVISYQFLTKNY